jgi:hypothetical protein
VLLLHGGILETNPLVNLEEILNIMPPFDQEYISFFEPPTQDNIMNNVYNSVLWADPCDPDDDLKKSSRPGFLPASTVQFLSSNKIDIIFRAHEVQKHGTGLYYMTLMLIFFLYTEFLIMVL